MITYFFPDDIAKHFLRELNVNTLAEEWRKSEFGQWIDHNRKFGDIKITFDMFNSCGKVHFENEKTAMEYKLTWL